MIARLGTLILTGMLLSGTAALAAVPPKTVTLRVGEAKTYAAGVLSTGTAAVCQGRIKLATLRVPAPPQSGLRSQIRWQSGQGVALRIQQWSDRRGAISCYRTETMTFPAGLTRTYRAGQLAPPSGTLVACLGHPELTLRVPQTPRTGVRSLIRWSSQEDFSLRITRWSNGRIQIACRGRG
jgi:hypothetical protein